MKNLLAKIQTYIMLWLALLVASVWGLAWASSPISSGDNTPVVVAVSSGSSAHRIARQLQDAGLVRHYRFFVLTVGIRGEGDQLKPGMYELSRDMSLVRIIGKLVRGDVAASWITIPEGYNVRQIAAALSEKKLVDECEFLRLALHEASQFAEALYVPSGSLEGYLFPDTYLFPKDCGSEHVIREMLTNFAKKASKPFESEIAASAISGREGITTRPQDNLHSVVTLASLIEREALTDEDRPLISSVMRNRLQRNMPLQIDATVQYALGAHRARLYYRDYATPSDYNTYLHGGLPPGPIASPGLKSIKAALDPADTDYLYYVATGSGSHKFTRSLDEHNRAVAAARRERQRSETK